jgi:hypothetical protein
LQPDSPRRFFVHFPKRDFFKPSLEGGRLLAVLLSGTQRSGAPIRPCSMIQKGKNTEFRTIRYIIGDSELVQSVNTSPEFRILGDYDYRQ